MIIKKTWEKLSVKTFGIYRYADFYTGYFLFGIIPLYINRDRVKRIK